MLDLDTRRAILTLRDRGHGIRTIARALGISRNAVRRVLRDGAEEVPRLARIEQATEWLERIRELHERCGGNLVRVQELLEAEDKVIAYSTLTGFCRRHGIGVQPKVRKGSYHFEPGEEMQHDTSPHRIVVGGVRGSFECASVVECYSRMLFSQVYPVWNRFHCKVFLTEAAKYFGGSAGQWMVDNHAVAIASGTGADAVVAPEMEAFAERFGTKFVAHEKGDANRSARVEGPFHFIEKNFYPGRTFSDLPSLNEQLIAWCDRNNQSFKRSLGARPIDLFVATRAALQPLPMHVPEVYELHHRMVDLEGYVNVHRNRYSVPEELIGRPIVVRESKDQIRVFAGHREVAVHQRCDPGAGHRRVIYGHHKPRPRRRRREPLPEELTLRGAGAALGHYIDALRRRHGGRAARPVRELHRMYVDYPGQALQGAVEDALRYGMLDLKRLERMVLRRIATDFFRRPGDDRSER